VIYYLGKIQREGGQIDDELRNNVHY
jgi:hypothetical protein